MFAVVDALMLVNTVRYDVVGCRCFQRDYFTGAEREQCGVAVLISNHACQSRNTSWLWRSTVCTYVHTYAESVNICTVAALRVHIILLGVKGKSKNEIHFTTSNLQSCLVLSVSSVFANRGGLVLSIGSVFAGPLVVGPSVELQYCVVRPPGPGIPITQHAMLRLISSHFPTVPGILRNIAEDLGNGRMISKEES
jgi:hypothetical protein